MNETRRKRIVYAVFVITVIWGIYNQPWKSRESDPLPKDYAPADTTVVLGDRSPDSRKSAMEPNLAGLDWSLDPFRPVAPGNLSIPSLQSQSNLPALQGTMTVGGAVRCVLDGKVFRVGEKIGVWSVERIDPGEVTLTGDGSGRITLRADNSRRNQPGKGE